MRIAVVSLYLPTGLLAGVPMQVHRISNELVRRGHSVTVSSLYPRPEDARYDVNTVSQPPWIARRVATLKGLGILTFPWYVAKGHFADFDVVHAHGDSHFIRTERPLLRTFHSSGVDEALHSKRLRHILGLLAVYPCEWWSGSQATQCVFVAESLKRYYPGLSGIVIPNAVDLDQFVPDPTAKSEHPSILFVAGTIEGRKRGRLLLQQFRDIVLPPHPKAELWMICPQKVEGPNVVWLGTQSTDALVRYYQKSWIYVLPSSHENFGVPYIEAMACGTPVVATPNDGARTVLDNGRYGRMTSPFNLGGTLSDLLGDPGERRRLAAAGIERAKAYALASVVDRYEQVLHDLLEKDRAS